MGREEGREGVSVEGGREGGSVLGEGERELREEGRKGRSVLERGREEVWLSNQSTTHDQV